MLEHQVASLTGSVTKRQSSKKVEGNFAAQVCCMSMVSYNLLETEQLRPADELGGTHPVFHGAAGTHSTSGALSPAQSSSTCPRCLSESPQHARHTAGKHISPLQEPLQRSPLVSSLQQPGTCMEANDSQQGAHPGCTLSRNAASPLGPSSLGSPIARAAQADTHPPANSGADPTTQKASDQAQRVAASADATFHRHSASAEGAEKGAWVGRLQARSTERSDEAALCDELSNPQGPGWEAHTGPSSRSSSAPREQLQLSDAIWQNAATWQMAGEEVADSRGHTILDEEPDRKFSSCGSVQHSTQPTREEESLEEAQPPSEDSAALPRGASPQPGTLSPTPGRQHTELFNTRCAGDEEERPSDLSMPLPHEHNSQEPGHRQSHTGAAGCSSAEPSPSAWAGYPHSPTSSPHSHHAPDGGAPGTALQETVFSDSGSQAADQARLAGDGQPQQDGVDEGECFVDPTVSVSKEIDIAHHKHAWRSNALSQVHCGTSAAGATARSSIKPTDSVNLASEPRQYFRADGDLSSISQDCDGPPQDKATDNMATQRRGMTPEEDELSRRMRSFLARLSDDSPSARGCDSVDVGTAISLQAAQGSEGMSDMGDDPGSEQVTWLTSPALCAIAICCLGPICIQGHM